MKFVVVGGKDVVSFGNGSCQVQRKAEIQIARGLLSVSGGRQRLLLCGVLWDVSLFSFSQLLFHEVFHPSVSSLTLINVLDRRVCVWSVNGYINAQ